MQQSTEKSHISPQKVVLGLDVPAAQAPSSSRLPWSRGEKAFVFVASLLFLTFCIGSIKKEAVTVNETVHIPAGLSYLTFR